MRRGGVRRGGYGKGWCEEGRGDMRRGGNGVMREWNGKEWREERM